MTEEECMQGTIDDLDRELTILHTLLLDKDKEVKDLREFIKYVSNQLDTMCRRGTAKDPGVLAVVFDCQEKLYCKGK